MELGAHEEVLTFGDLASEWLRSSAGMGIHEPSTSYNAKTMLDRHVVPVLGHREVASITATEVERLYADLGRVLKPSSVRRIHNLVARAFEVGVRRGIIDANPARAASRPPKRFPEVEIPTPDEVHKLITGADERMALLVRVAASTGARRGELLALRREHIDFEERVMTVSRAIGVAGGQSYEKATKTGKTRRVGLHAALAASLATFLDGRPGRYVFGDATGNPWRPQSVTRSFRTLCKRTGVGPYRFHALRHYCATHLLSGGVHPQKVADRLGHGVSVLLETYGHVLPHDDERAAEVMGILDTRVEVE